MSTEKEKAILTELKEAAAEIIARPSSPAVPQLVFTDAERSLICRGLSDDQAITFLRICKHTGLDPIARQIYALPFRNEMVPVTGIDGYRLMSARSGKYQGTTEGRLFVKTTAGQRLSVPHSEYDPDEHTIISATIGVRMQNNPEPVFATALMKSFHKNTDTWRSMPDVMLLKCAEAAAHRKANPTDLASGLYIQEELPEAALSANKDQIPPKPARAQTTATVVSSPDLDTSRQLDGIRVNLDKRLTAIKADAVRDKVISAFFEFTNLTGWDEPAEDAQIALATEFVTKRAVALAKKLMEE